LKGTCSGAVGWGTALRLPIVSMEIFIDIILPITLWPWGRSVYLATLPLCVPTVLKFGSLSLLESFGSPIGLYRDCFTFYLILLGTTQFVNLDRIKDSTTRAVKYCLMGSYIVYDKTSVPTFRRTMKSPSSEWEFGSDGSRNDCNGKICQLCRKVARILASRGYWRITSSQALRTHLNKINSLRKRVQ